VVRRRRSKPWRTKKRSLLAWWTKKLYKRNLRGLDKRTILACVPKGKTTSRAHRIAVLKALYEYLRNPEQRLASHPAAQTLSAGDAP
jgi:hypothetical protein